MIKKLFVLLLLGSISLSGAVVAAASPSSSTQAQTSEVSPAYIPCDYYPTGHHVYVKVGSRTYSESGGTHPYIITRPDGSQQAVDCQISNWYRQDTFACACGKTTTGSPSFVSTTHQYH
ncbi:hypothetical protein ACF3MZ_24855 [Paenibacillaceae bacterium WGS1546]|uniref:hypothetical protein n=1 Tax=Cohnella sp. WGS1546 TaxID=3366810 RepID=UPI00372D22D9